VALLSFPPSPFNGQIYPNPTSAPVNTNIYRWDSAEQTWILLGRSSGVTPGTYGTSTRVPRFTVDFTGRISFAEDLAIPLGDTTQVGLVQLVDNTVTNDPTKALTAAQGFSLQQQINIIDAWTANDIPLLPTINGSTTVQQALGDAIYNITSPGLSVVVAQTPVGQVTLDVTQATETQLGGAEIATQAEVDAGTDNTRIVTPLRLATYISGGQISATEVPLSPAINGNTTVQAALTDAIYNVSSSGSSVTITETATGQINLAVAQATETQQGGGEIATQTEANTGTSDTTLITPLKLRTTLTNGSINSSNIQLSTAINGNTTVQSALLDAVYNIASSGNTVVITSSPTGLFNVEVRQATETQLGGGEIATQVETDAGTDDTRIVTPLKLRTAITGGSINSSTIQLSTPINGNTTVQSALNDAIYNIASSGSSVTITETATGQINLAVTQATETQLGGAEIATQAEVNAGTDNTRIVTPQKLSAYISTGGVSASTIVVTPAINGNTDVQSVLSDAIYSIASANNSVTIAETATGQINLAVTQATEAQLGGASVATQAEVNTGTNDTKFVTPSKLATYISGGQINATEIALSPAINGNTTVQTALADAIYNVASANASLTVAIAATGQVTLTPVSATDTLAGVVELATPAEVVTGTSTTLATTPQGVRNATVYKSDYNAKGAILSAAAAGNTTILPVGTNAQYLVADSTAATGLKWYTLPSTVGVSGSVSNAGITTITDNLTSTSVDSALSANQGKLLQTQIAAILLSSNLTFAGTVGATGLLTLVTTAGAAEGFTLGSPLPSPAPTNVDFFVICTEAGTFTPPASAAVNVTQGDWLISTGTTWEWLNVGYDPTTASTTQAGIVELATDAETQTGTDTTRAITPSNLTSRTATETRTGIAEIATQVETDAGTDDTRIVTPLKLKTYVTNSPQLYHYTQIDNVASSFNGVLTAFTLRVGGVAYTPNPTGNLTVFLGGIAQTPGASEAYTVSGSTITFTSAPPAGTSFYATTVTNT
jgi:hypothetical protein